MRLWLVSLLLVACGSQLAAGEKGGGAESDPILADAKATAEAAWCPRFDVSPGSTTSVAKSPWLQICVKLQGKAVEQASAWGGLKLIALSDQQGRPYRWACDSYPSVGGEMNGVWHNLNGETNDGMQLRFTIANRPAIESIRELTGSIALETGGKTEVVTVDGAFKGLVDIADMANADPDNWAPPLADKRLKSLGMKVTVVRKPVREQPDTEGPKPKDEIHIGIESPECAVVGIEILNAAGKVIPSAGLRSWCGEKPKWSFSTDFLEVIPRDGRLRLTVQKGDRRVRLPFSLKDIAAPKITKGDPVFDVPASLDDAYVAAESVSPKDPILAGLKIRPKLSWRTWRVREGRPDLEVQVDFEGQPVNEVSGYGEVDIESAVDEAGRPIDLRCDHADMHVRFCDSDRFSVDLIWPHPPMVQKIGRLRGSLSIQVGGKLKGVTLKGFMKKLTVIDGSIKGDMPPEPKYFDDAELKELGVTISGRRTIKLVQEYHGVESLSFNVEWKRNPVVGFKVCDSGGETLRTGSSSLSYTGPRSVVWWRVFPEAVPEDAQATLYVQQGYRKIRVPFEFKDVVVPEVPKDEEKPYGTLRLK